jgi:hypothetical protein
MHRRGSRAPQSPAAIILSRDDRSRVPRYAGAMQDECQVYPISVNGQLDDSGSSWFSDLSPSSPQAWRGPARIFSSIWRMSTSQRMALRSQPGGTVWYTTAATQLVVPRAATTAAAGRPACGLQPAPAGASHGHFTKLARERRNDPASLDPAARGRRTPTVPVEQR